MKLMIKVIFGLGNPGKKFQNTRHNFGSLIIDRLAKNQGFVFSLKPDFESLITELALGQKKVFLAKPQTMMNDSGRAIKKIGQYYRIQAQEILVIHDDFDLSFGQMKFTFGQGAAGHHGIESVIENLGTKNFFRLRLGTQPEKSSNIPLEKFVLQKFTRREKKKIPLIIKKAIEIISMTVKQPDASPEKTISRISNL